MQDRLKFRIWDKPTSRMFYDVALGFIKAPMRSDWVCADTPDGQISYTGERLKDIEIMQCTGLKDKNGKLIYEGDIVRINDKYPDYSAIDDFYKNQNFVLEYFAPQAKYLMKPSEYYDNSGDGIYELSPDFYEFLNWDTKGIEYGLLQGIEVIGNIYENPELLEGKCNSI